MSAAISGTRSPFLGEGKGGRVQLHVAGKQMHRVPVPGNTTVTYSIEVHPGHGAVLGGVAVDETVILLTPPVYPY